ncbi:MAG: protein kinase [Polyangiaceae bacterium]|nr:protein kinase [Polyangiaceae bacterium]
MQVSPVPLAEPRIVGRYALYGEIAAGGMATVHFGRLVGAVGFSRTVAVKRLHPQYAKDPDFVSMFLDEARLAARIRHPNVVSTLDVVPLDDEVFLVMEYIHGEALSKLIRSARRQGELVPPRVAVAIMAGALHGLHAAHEAKSEQGVPLNLVHRDISPQNILVGTDGAPRVLDFGVAKAAARVTSTRDGQMKGKVAYMAPEQLRGKGVDRRSDVFASGIVLWETLTGRRLFDGDDPGEIMAKLLQAEIPTPSSVEPGIPAHLDAIVMRALTRDAEGRWPTAREMAIALEHAGPIAMAREVGEWTERVGEETIGKRARQVAEIESGSLSHIRAVDSAPMSAPPSIASRPVHLAPADPVPTSWPAGGAPGDPITSPSQVSHVTSASRPSGGTSPTHASGLSVAHSVAPRRRGVLAALIGVAVALGVAITVLAVILLWRKKPEASDVVASDPSPPAQTTPAAVSPEPAPTPEVPPAGASVAPPAASAEPPAASAEPEPKPAAKPAARPAVGGGIKKPAAPPKAPADGCDPPFTVDKNGVRRVKPGCM